MQVDRGGDRAELGIGRGQVETLERGHVHCEFARGEIVGEVDRLGGITKRPAKLRSGSGQARALPAEFAGGRPFGGGEQSQQSRFARTARAGQQGQPDGDVRRD